MEWNPAALPPSPGMRILEKGDLHVANLVGVTNPVPNYDASNNNRTLPAAPKPSDTRIQNIPDPSRVGRPDARTDQQGANDALNSGVLRYDSNLQLFPAADAGYAGVGAELSKLVTLMQGLVNHARLGGRCDRRVIRISGTA